MYLLTVLAVAGLILEPLRPPVRLFQQWRPSPLLTERFAPMVVQ
jgi:hypothetical protein